MEELKQQILRAITMYVEGRVSADAFCDEFYVLFTTNHDTAGIFSAEQGEVLQRLSTLSARYAAPEFHTDLPGVYFNDAELMIAAQNAMAVF